MAVLQMKRMNLCALKKDRKKILELLQRCGSIEVSDAVGEDAVFRKSDLTPSLQIFMKNILTAKQALEILNDAVPVKKPMLAALDGKRRITEEQYDSFSGRHDEIISIANRLTTVAKHKAEHHAEILKLEAQKEALVPWLNMDVPLSFQGTKSTCAFIGSLPGELTLEDVYVQIAEQAPKVGAITVEIISTSQDITCIFLLCRKKDHDVVSVVLGSLGFAHPALQQDKPPKAQIAFLEDRIAQSHRVMEKIDAEIISYAGKRSELEFLADFDTMRSEKYDVIGRLMQSKRTFLLTGYVPQRDAAKLEDGLNRKFDLAIEFSDPAEGEDVPILLRNNAFSAPVEGVLESFSLPGKGEFDPSSLMALFYYFLFGMMLSDAAYGFIMSLICGILLYKHKNMESGLRNSLWMFFYSGISTIFWGVMFGGYFGDAVDVIGKTFFHVNVTIPPLWFAPLNQPMRLLVFCLFVGVIHLFVGLGANFYQLWRAKKYKDAVFDVLFWYMLVTGLIILLLSTSMMTDMFALSFTISAGVANAAAVISMIGAVGIILTGGRESCNPVKRILKGLYSLYNVTAYLSDILSYSRLLALGLATGVIASVVNKMGSMVGGGVIGAIAFTIIFILGHSMNIAINMLGSYVHTNRLQYVEFFGKFYSGGGRKFTPFSAATHTKYYQFKEEK